MQVRTAKFAKSDWVPNNERLPVVFYQSVFITENGTEEFARLFTSHGCQVIWRNGVFDYQHYHTGAHEVLGVGRGCARLLIGGPTGQVFDVKAGDCLLLPAGTGHMNLGGSTDFEVVGGYPPGQRADIQTNAPSRKAIETISSLQLPETDPIAGATGPMITAWDILKS
jgi:uncharacterized protein YjlB